MPDTIPAAGETAARGFKACRLADALTKLASPTADESDVGPLAAWQFAEAADDAAWLAAEALAGVRPASPQTRATTLTILWARSVDADLDPFRGF